MMNIILVISNYEFISVILVINFKPNYSYVL